MARKKIDEIVDTCVSEQPEQFCGDEITLNENEQYEVISQQSTKRQAKAIFYPEINGVGIALFAGDTVKVPHTSNSEAGYNFTVEKGLRVCYNNGEFVWIKNTRNNRILLANKTRIDE